MKTRILGCIILASLLTSLHAATFWNYYRHSGNLAITPNQYEVQIRINSINADTTGFTAEYRLNNIVNAIPMTYVQDHHLTTTRSYKSTIQRTNPNLFNIGFRHLNSAGELHLAPVKFSGTQPVWAEMSEGNTDPVGDAAFPVPSLDLTDWRITYDDTNIYIAMKNNSNSYPVNSEFTFYAYMGAIINPADSSANPVVYGLMNTITVGDIIGPGLYKITGTGLTDMERLGDITISNPAGSNILYITCSWADLLADEDFNTWFNEEGCFEFTTLTQNISLVDGVLAADEAVGATIYPFNEQYEFVDNHIPVLSNLYITSVLPDPEPGNMFINIMYTDIDEDFPLSATVEFDSGENSVMYPNGLVYAIPVWYENSYFPAEFYYSGNWQTMTIKFWYTNEAYVDTVITNTGTHDPLAPSPQLTCNVYPNPFAKEVNIRVDVPKQDNAVISIYNIRGQLVKRLHEGMLEKGTQTFVWETEESSLADKASGMYFLKIVTANGSITKKLIKLK